MSSIPLILLHKTNALGESLYVRGKGVTDRERERVKDRKADLIFLINIYTDRDQLKEKS